MSLYKCLNSYTVALITGKLKNDNLKHSQNSAYSNDHKY